MIISNDSGLDIRFCINMNERSRKRGHICIVPLVGRVSSKYKLLHEERCSTYAQNIIMLDVEACFKTEITVINRASYSYLSIFLHICEFYPITPRY